MLVEVFEDEEVRHEHPEVAQEAIDLMLELGLTGQFDRAVNVKNGEVAPRMPYRRMTYDERFVYGVLLPKQQNVANYDGSTIPLRVLQVIAHAKDYFAVLKVWDKESAMVNDPVLIGYVKNQWDPPHLLARWGDELEAFPVLAEKAVKMYRDKVRTRCAEVIAEAQAIAASVEGPGVPSSSRLHLSYDGTVMTPKLDWSS